MFFQAQALSEMMEMAKEKEKESIKSFKGFVKFTRKYGKRIIDQIYSGTAWDKTCHNLIPKCPLNKLSFID